MKTAAPHSFQRRFGRTLLASVIALYTLGAQAQTQPVAEGEGTMVRLIRSLISSGALKPEDGELLLAQARHEATAASPPQRTTTNTAQLQDGDVRVPYIPQTVRDEIRDEVKTGMMAQAREERWAAPDSVPDWTRRLRLFGDVRVRNESRLFSDNNSIIEADWNQVNQGVGYDVNPNTNLLLPPMQNTREDRTNLWPIRMRFGVLADFGGNFTAGTRVTTGNNNNPVSDTQILGEGLTKRNIWLDQAWLQWQPADWLRVVGGRFANPYWSNDTLFSEDLNFDGLAVNYYDQYVNERLQVFGTLGLTPMEYSRDDFPTTRQFKERSWDKWLNGLQIGAEWAFDDDHRLRGALAYYDFRRISGRLSEPCALYTGVDFCSTDWTRPVFMQKGNTLMLLRDIVLNPNDPANTPQPQYVGLASDFRLLAVNLRWKMPSIGRYALQLEGSWTRNLAYDPQEMWQRSRGGIVTNLANAANDTPTAADIDSGDTAYSIQAIFGSLALQKAGDWNAWLGYKHIDPDALPDGYNDSNFHLGGTNAKGYYLGGSYLFHPHVGLTGRWMGAKEVSGAPLSIDLFQLEINADF